VDRLPDTQDPITMVISEIVEPDQIQAYEVWAKGINHAAQQFDGFLGVEVIRPRDHAHPEYVVIVKFDNYRHFRNWSTSPEYQRWIDKSRNLIAARSHQELPTGIELWFNLPNQLKRKIPQAAYYKSVIVGVIAVYPLILLANVLLGPLLNPLPSLLGLLISVTFVSALLTYPVMPWLTTLLSGWLYPSVSRRDRSYSSR
jgi:antibiotic biosynthesis monooxygenase (ABM) superfamily enzyme